LDRPVTVALVAEPPTVTGVPAVEPAYGVTVYPVIALPPLLDGADHDTNAIDDAGLAATPCGADGTPARAGDAARSSDATIVATTARDRHEDDAISQQTIGMAQNLRATSRANGSCGLGRAPRVRPT
jgi:hypothetical protein